MFNLLQDINVPAGTELPKFNDVKFDINNRGGASGENGFHIKVGDTIITKDQLLKK